MEITHKIKYINDYPIVTLYVNYPDEYEFALDFNTFKKNVVSVASNVKEYIKKNFDKNKTFAFVLVLNGLIVGTILSTEIDSNQLNASSSSDTQQNYTTTEFLDTNLNDNADTSETENIGTNTITEEKSEETTTNEINESEQATQSTQVNQPSQNTKNVSNSTASQSTTSTEKSQTTTVTSNSSQNTNTSSNTSTATNTSNSKTVNVKLSSGTVVTMSLEDYVYGVVAGEMPASFSLEALKAQAVASRTYALKKLSSYSTLSATTTDQVFKTESEIKSLWGSSYNIYSSKVRSAVDATSGQYLTYNGKYIEALFFSTSNGKTEDAVYVWGNSVPYLKSVDSKWDVGISSYSSTKSFTYSQLSSKLGVTINSSSNISINSKTTGDRVNSVTFASKTFTGVKVRSLLGLRSADFDISKTSTGVTFTCRGYGHGVGMSQYGANGMAKAGYSYEQILKHYYTGVTLNK